MSEGTVVAATARCRAHCHNYPYFGLQHTNECFCGTRYGTHGATTGCVHCGTNSGNANCGGKNAVFRTYSTYVGCFNDNTDSDTRSRSMPNTGTASSAGSISSGTSSVADAMMQCSGTCAGYRYYGLQGGNECFCGNTYARWGGAGDCTGCGISDRTGDLGCDWRLMVFYNNIAGAEIGSGRSGSSLPAAVTGTIRRTGNGFINQGESNAELSRALTVQLTSDGAGAGFDASIGFTLGFDAAITCEAPVCLGWRNTGSCDPAGSRSAHLNPSADKGCDAIISSDESGYCECGGGQAMVKGCETGAHAICIPGRLPVDEGGAYQFRGQTTRAE